MLALALAEANAVDGGGRDVDVVGLPAGQEGAHEVADLNVAYLAVRLRRVLRALCALRVLRRLLKCLLLKLGSG